MLHRTWLVDFTDCSIGGFDVDRGGEFNRSCRSLRYGILCHHVSRTAGNYDIASAPAVKPTKTDIFVPGLSPGATRSHRP
jgi:hypothetical protein